MRSVTSAFQLLAVVLAMSLLTGFGWPKDDRSPAEVGRGTL